MIHLTELALKRAANKASLGTNEYLDRTNRGQKFCSRCLDWHPVEAYGRDRARRDGLAPACRESTNAAARARYAAMKKLRQR